MDVLILGLNHQIQPAMIKNWSSDGLFQQFEQDQKETFAQFLYDLLHERGIEFVGEEAKHGEDTIAQRLCAQENYRYSNVEMLPEERRQRNIPRDYSDNPNVSQQERDRCNLEREQYMCEQAIVHAAQAHRILIICGRLHMNPIAAELGRQGHCVQTSDIQEQDWYVENWFDHF
jgi:hypothetical protein